MTGIQVRSMAFVVALATAVHAAAWRLPGLEKVVVTAERANVKTGNKVVAAVSRGDELTVVGRQGKWVGVQIVREGKQIRGWILATQVAPAADTATTKPAKTKPPAGKARGGLTEVCRFKFLASYVAFSPDGRFVAAHAYDIPKGMDSNIRVWDVRARRLTMRIKARKQACEGFRFLSDGKRLVSGGSADGHVQIWDVSTGRLLREMKLGRTFAVSHDEKKVAAAELGISMDEFGSLSAESLSTQIMVWDFRTGDALHGFPFTKGIVNDVKFFPDGNTIASGSDEGFLHLWDLVGKKEVCRVEGRSEFTWQTEDGKPARIPVTAVSVSADGRVVAFGDQVGRIWLWDVRKRKIARTLKETDKKAKTITSLDFSPDSRRLLSAGGLDKTVRMWDTATGKELCCVKSKGCTGGVAFSPDGGHAVSCGEDGVRIWRVQPAGKRPTTSTSAD